MKSKILFLLLCVFSLSASGQTQGTITRKKPKTESTTSGGQSKQKQKKQTSGSSSNKTRTQESSSSRTSASTQQTSSSSTQYATVSQGVQYGSHYYVDLGLPSGTKWATTNVGASSPSDYGNYYAWGETSTKSSYDWSNLRYWTGDSYDNVKFSKYVTESKFGNVDGKKELDLSDDAAYVNWGSGWHMPSKAQQDELRVKCTWTWTSMGGHDGYKVVGPNGSSLFLPAAGYRYDSSSVLVGTVGYYWSRTLCAGTGCFAYVLYFNSGDVDWSINDRYYGWSVRPVLAP